MILPYQGLVIYGCGGHARSVADVALSIGIHDFIFVDAKAKKGESLFGFPIQTTLDKLPENWGVFSAQGDNATREKTISDLHSSALANIISHQATIGKDVVLELGVFVGHHAHIGPFVRIGTGCIINTSAVVEHDCVVGDFTHISVNTALCGKVFVGNHCFIGAGATIIDGIRIADNVMVGAGAVVTQDITEAGTYLGVPASKANR